MEKDEVKLTTYFDGARQACWKNFGTQHCACSTNDKWNITSPGDSLTDLFFCLPKECLCNDGTIETIEPMVNWPKSVYFAYRKLDVLNCRQMFQS